MKFFTQEYYESDNEVLIRSAWRRYEQHLESLNGIFPNRILELARMRVEFHDALLAYVHRNYAAQQLTLTLRCGYLQVGYFDLKLRYSDAEISASHERSLEQIARTTRNHTQFKMRSWTHEIDSTDNERIVHRIFFDSLALPPCPSPLWIEIVCRDLHWENTSRPNRELPRMRERFTREGIAPESETSHFVQCLLNMSIRLT